MIRVLFGRRQPSTARADGDRARDVGDWAEAVRHYRAHLATRRGDHAIRIQLGHALKEMGALDAALAAYRVALRRRQRDADLLLSIGHVHKLAGRPAEALRWYRRSAELDGNRHALTELDALRHAGVAPPTTGDRARAVKLLARRCAGLVPIEACDIAPAARGRRLQLLSHDPWVTLALDPAVASAGGLGVLTIDVRPLDSERPLQGQVYVDYGDGFVEKTSLSFRPGATGVALLLAAPELIRGVRWDPDRKSNLLHLPRLGFRTVADFGEAAALLRDSAAGELDPEPLVELARTCFDRRALAPREAAEVTLALMLSDVGLDTLYRRWLFRHGRPAPEDYAVIRAMTDAMPVRPTFSFVMPTYNTPVPLLCACLDALLAQTWPDFEICVADDHSPDPAVVETLADYAARDARLRYVRSPVNGHISDASNRALALATGDFVVLVDHDDVIPDYTLFVVAHYINQHPTADVLFSDEDKIDLQDNRFAPYFKGAFSRFLMYGHNMVSHLGVYRRALLNEIGGFRIGLEGSQDYDLLLRCYERCGDGGIVHIPHVLYHWRTTPGSTAISADQKGYAIVAAERAINEHFERTGLPFRSGEGFAPGCTGVFPARAFDTPVSIIIPTRNGLDVLAPCIASILAAPHDRVEIIVVDNGSDDPATLSYLAEREAAGVIRVVRDERPFNFSALNNMAAEYASGEILCFLNNDTELLAADWLARARALLSLDEVGVVGARLLFPDGTLQHFGIALGIADHRVAGTPHGGFSADDPGYFGKARLMQEFSAVTAACLFIRRADFLAVGGFEPELRVAYNDVDLCLKVRARGLKIVGDPDILLIHKESRTRGSDKKGPRAERLAQEAAWMHARWGKELRDDPFWSPNLSLDRLDFAPALRPRVPFPWEQGAAA
ncbi:glycosyltransferase [Sphingomonas sp. RHCKR7]|uniref:glycosyltransferase n=1 Tax=Sphingomonas folli TaxID=2862497 RepID=UPI001CA5C781|nr:glycosyltransferase [Sphingomonas folli]MBW6526764.1 glycosyltransferase [Sphingomonas folli]